VLVSERFRSLLYEFSRALEFATAGSAFTLGCPVIAADMPGAKKQFEDAAILVNPADELQIVQALQSVFSDNAKREVLIHRGKKRADRFTGRDFAEGLLDLLDEFEPIRQCWFADSQELPRS